MAVVGEIFRVPGEDGARSLRPPPARNRCISNLSVTSLIGTCTYITSSNAPQCLQNEIADLIRNKRRRHFDRPPSVAPFSFADL